MTDQDSSRFSKLLKHPLKFRLFLLTQLPSAFFSGVRVKHLSESQCETTVPYKWFSKNPFRSTYFACLAMAAEMSTGVLCLARTYKRKPAVSMLVLKMECEYFKKAISRTSFTCEDGAIIGEAINETIGTGEPTTARARSIGRNAEGMVIAEFYITWSFKARK